MSYTIVIDDITNIESDIIVNASNGIGYMGGTRGIREKLKGVAEAIHFKTQGSVEKEAKRICRKRKFLPMWLVGGFEVGEVFVTGPGNLRCKKILHAVTMPFPGMNSRLDIVEKVVPNIISECRELNAKTVAIPILGAGTGGLPSEDVIEIYERYFASVEDMFIKIVIFK